MAIFPSNLLSALSSNVSQKRRSDVMIAVMGPTGTGKSSLIQLVTKDKGIKVGHGVRSETSEIKLANCFEPDGRCVTFVDTPGFDDSREGVTDSVILKKIAAFLDREFKDGRKLNGLIYLHRITDPRMGGISARNLRMFKKLCGSDSLKNVVIVTTRWDEVQESTGVERETELMTSPEFFQPLIAAGARFLRHDNTVKSSKMIMEKLLDNDPIALQIQEELGRGMCVQDTAAGSELSGDVNALIEKHKAELDSLRRELEEAIVQKDTELKEELKKERDDMKRKLEKWEAEKRNLQDDFDAFRKQADVQHEEAKKGLEEQRDQFLDQLSEEMKKNRVQMDALLSEVQERRNREEAEAKERKERRAREEETALQHTELFERLKKAAVEKEQSDRRWEQLLGEERERAKQDKAEADRRFEELLSRMPKTPERPPPSGLLDWLFRIF